MNGMVSCGLCKKQFSRNYNLHRHIDQKICTTKLINCKFCYHKFTTKNSMYRHIREICKNKNNVMDAKEENLKKREDERKEEIYKKLILLEEENERLKKQLLQSNIVNNVTINNGTINNNTVNNIILIGYGKEDISKIERDDILKSIKSGFSSSLELTDTIHFNPKYPEYHNVYISNIRDKYGMMYDGKDWTLIPKNELIDRIYDEKKSYIEENIEDFYDSLSKSQINALDRWFETEDGHDRIIAIKEKIKLLLYNKRNIPLNTKNKNARINST